MPSLVFKEQQSNKDPIDPGGVQEWVDFDGPKAERGAWLISAFADRIPGPAQSDTLRVEDVRSETTRDEEGDPTHKLHFQVRNVGPSTINRYVVNVWHVLP
jgi:hypothetical protein